MKTLHIAVKDKVATYELRDGALICENAGQYEIAFSFDSEWAGRTAKTARFCYNGQAVDVPFTGATVTVPKIINAHLLEVGVYAGDLITSTPAFIPCRLSILSTDPIHADPPEDVYNRLMALIGPKYLHVIRGNIGVDSTYFSGTIRIINNSPTPYLVNTWEHQAQATLTAAEIAKCISIGGAVYNQGTLIYSGAYSVSETGSTLSLADDNGTHTVAIPWSSYENSGITDTVYEL